MQLSERGDDMFELTNEQRRCFAIPPVLDSWNKVELKASRYDNFVTYAFLDGRKIVKVIQVSDDAGNALYMEYGVDQTLSEDGTKILPKTDKGKPEGFTAANLTKKTPIGMSLSFNRGYVALVNNTAEQCFYRSAYNGEKPETLEDFSRWVENWCLNTGENEQTDVREFAGRVKIHQKFREGDFFRFRINRRLFGYGRILVDYAQMRKDGIAFWDMFMGKPLCVAVYHIATEDKCVSPESLVKLETLPSQMIMDNVFYYGECEIIGNMPIDPDEDNYTVHYGEGFDARSPDCIHYQCGKVYVSVEGAEELVLNKDSLSGDFINGDIGWDLDVKLPILLECIRKKSNAPYWKMTPEWVTDEDLRNPKYKRFLKKIKKQMGIK